MDKDSFVFRKEWRDAISGLPDEVRLEIYEAIIEYGISGKSSDLKPMAMLAFNFAKTALNKDLRKYEQVCKKRSDAANKRWERYKCIQIHTNDTNASDNDCDNDIKSDNIKKESKKKKDAAHAAALLKERKEDFYNSLIPFVTQYGKYMIRAFFDYWSEFNKSNTKMRYELERTWEVGKRLRACASKENQFYSKGNGTKNNRYTSEARAQDAANIIDRLAAEEKE